jgi:tetratricopeptide (TPR) repeat protein
MTFLLIGFVITTLTPVWISRWHIRHGNAAAITSRGGKADAAVNHYQNAAAADPLSPDPWRQLFEWSTGGGRLSNESFDSAVKQLQELMVRDPLNFWAMRTLGELWEHKWKNSGDIDDATQAVEWLRKAHELYPTNSTIQAELALALVSAGDMATAAQVAVAALKQDEIYQRCGHVDRYLDKPLRDRLQELAAESGRK